MTKPNFPLPLLEWLLGYRKEWCGSTNAVTTAAVAIPKAMADVTFPGQPVQVGLYTAFVPLIIYAVSARHAR
jgi:MFS superfamily sulfate permease-like transporter